MSKLLLYLNCYVVGEGYTLKRMALPDLQELTAIRRKDMPDCEAAIFTGTSAPYLFLGTVENRRFGCVRDIETALKDENGRHCYIHIALEAEMQEADIVDAVLQFALHDRRRFVNLCNKMVIDQSGDYHVDTEALCTLIDEAKRKFANTAPAGLLIPQTSADDFFAKAGNTCKREDFQSPFSYEEWKGREPSIELFLYCSTPSSGFVLSRIDASSGEKLQTGKEANDTMLPWAQSILANSGAIIALFEQNGKVCFVGRGIQSASTDQYGRRKKLSLVLQAPVEQSLLVRQLAAWALVDFATFSEQLTECVKIYDGPRGYEVQGEKLSQMLDQLSQQVYISKDDPYSALWERVSAPPDGPRFLCLACEATLSYFCRSCNINISEQDVRFLLNTEMLQEIRKKPANLVFTPELYKAPVSVGETSTEPAGKAEKKDEAVSIEQPTSKPEVNSTATKKVEMPSAQKTVRPVNCVDNPPREISDFADEERIDLLQQKWFWPAVALLAVAIIGGAALWLHFRG